MYKLIMKYEIDKVVDTISNYNTVLAMLRILVDSRRKSPKKYVNWLKLVDLK